MVYQVYKRIQFGLIILVVGASFVFWVIVRPTCSDCVPVWVLAVDDDVRQWLLIGKFDNVVVE